ncbi:MAG: GIY-YIG nuclease family protein, partial [Ktedonobacterales bacterium]
MMGIYAIVNMVNGKRYIGSAVSIEKRWREHRRDFQIDDHHCVYLYRAWVKYGAETFNWIVLEEVADRNLLVEREQWWIDTTPSELLYNTCRVAGSTLGVIPGVETRAKMSAARKGRPKSAEHRAKIGLAHKGRTYSPDILAKMKAGRNRPEIKEKVAAAHRGRI